MWSLSLTHHTDLNPPHRPCIGLYECCSDRGIMLMGQEVYWYCKNICPCIQHICAPTSSSIHTELPAPVLEAALCYQTPQQRWRRTWAAAAALHTGSFLLLTLRLLGLGLILLTLAAAHALVELPLRERLPRCTRRGKGVKLKKEAGGEEEEEKKVRGIQTEITSWSNVELKTRWVCSLIADVGREYALC